MRNLFPHEEIRAQQDTLIEAVTKAVTTSGQLVVHAPTGLGKTAASLAPSISYALENDKTVIFLTSRHTQHEIALNTIRKINEKHNIKIPVTDLIGKKWFCLQPGAQRLRSKEFVEYCKALKADKQCEHFENLKTGEEPSSKTKLALTELSSATIPQIKSRCSTLQLCPYEVSILLAKKSRVIITDYNYLFNPGIAQRFLQKIEKELKDVIIVVDEAHNLPDRVKTSASDSLTTNMLQRAASEADKHSFNQYVTIMRDIAESLKKLALTIEERMSERYVTKDMFLQRVAAITDVDQLIEDLEKIGDTIREEQQYSYLGSVGEFLKVWKEGVEDGFTRILQENQFRDNTNLMLNYRCLDPSVVTGPIVNSAHACILMSGTLNPTRMYKELVGALKADEVVLKSPFLQENRLTIIIPKTSTKFTQRSDQMYKEIGEHCAKIANITPGNSAIFFPSYYLLNEVKKHFDTKTNKTVFSEQPGMSREEKHDFLERFKQYKDQGATLLGVISGNFGEGVDLPGDLLKTVVVVGLPLGKPDLETKALIRYFDNKYGRGWEYGYTFPAFNKTLQSAGRCIRTETDRGAIIFLDERYNWPQYKKCFPTEWDLRATVLYEGQLQQFFEK